MSELIENTIRIVEDFNEEVKSDLSSKGIDNTREAANSIRIESDDKSVKSVGIGYLYYLDQGRGPGKFPPPHLIEAWTINKPVEINPYLVGRKIAREGTNIYRDHSKGIQLEQKRKEVLAELKKKAPAWTKEDLLIKIKLGNRNIS